MVENQPEVCQHAEKQPEANPTAEHLYVPTNGEENLILGMLALSKRMSGTLPTKADFYDSLDQFGVEPTEEFLAKVHASFPELEI